MATLAYKKIRGVLVAKMLRPVVPVAVVAAEEEAVADLVAFEPWGSVEAPYVTRSRMFTWGELPGSVRQDILYERAEMSAPEQRAHARGLLSLERTAGGSPPGGRRPPRAATDRTLSAAPPG